MIKYKERLIEIITEYNRRGENRNILQLSYHLISRKEDTVVKLFQGKEEIYSRRGCSIGYNKEEEISNTFKETYFDITTFGFSNIIKHQEDV